MSKQNNNATVTNGPDAPGVVTLTRVSKIVNVGNSKALVLPVDLLEVLGWTNGDAILTTVHPGGWISRAERADK